MPSPRPSFLKAAFSNVFVMTFLYVASYLPYMFFTRALSTVEVPGLGRPLSGLESLPPVVMLGSVLLAIFVWWSGWWRAAHRISIFGVRVPFATKWTALSAVGTGMLLITVPLSLTFKEVSIPFMQLLMRGDVLILAPLIDFVFGRKVHWYSRLALGLVFVALIITTFERGGLHLPPLAIATIVIYTLGYLIRLAVMTKIAKDGNPETLKKYFVEEKIVAIPLGLVLLLVLGQMPFFGVHVEVGPIEIWTRETAGPLLGMAVCWFVVAIASAMILLGPQENSYCVPLERSASIISGTLATYGLALAHGLPAPTLNENIGTTLLIAAITVLSLGPRWRRRPAESRSAAT